MSEVHFEYKGYVGSARISTEDGCLYGKIEFIDDLVTYQADTVALLEEEFKAAVNDYITTCEEIGKSPNKSYSGTFNIRVGPSLHKSAASAAAAANKSLNELVKMAIEAYLAQGEREFVHHHRHDLTVRHLHTQSIVFATQPAEAGEPTWISTSPSRSRMSNLAGSR